MLARHLRPGRPDYIVPELIAVSPAALERYVMTMKTVWQNMERLLNRGVKEEYVMYLLPNAFPIRFEESGDLLNFHHKWTKRLCYTAQEEIWRSCKEEVMQVRQVSPGLMEHIAAPCALRQGAGVKPFCPEGDRYCGVRVWSMPVESYTRLI